MTAVPSGLRARFPSSALTALALLTIPSPAQAHRHDVLTLDMFDGSDRVVVEVDERWETPDCPPRHHTRVTRLLADGRLLVEPPPPGLEPGTMLQVGHDALAVVTETIARLLAPESGHPAATGETAGAALPEVSTLTVFSRPVFSRPGFSRPGFSRLSPSDAAAPALRFTHAEDDDLETVLSELANLRLSLAARARTQPIWFSHNPWPSLCEPASRARHGLEASTPPWCEPPAFSRPDPDRASPSDPAVRARIRERLALLPRGLVDGKVQDPLCPDVETTPDGVDLTPAETPSSVPHNVGADEEEPSHQQECDEHDPTTLLDTV